MKIKLIAPACKPEWGESFWDFKTFVKLTGRKSAGVLLALPTIAALTPPDIEISITDENVEPINFNEEVDLVGITFLTSLAPRAYEIANEYKKRGVKVVLGGIHASMLPNEAIQYADSVVIGEAENTWPQLISDLKKGFLQKFYKSDYPSLNKSPIPRWDLLKTESYCYFTIQTGRGCPFTCEFCSVRVFNGQKYRHKSIENILDEIKFIQSIDKNKNIFFADDNFLANTKYAADLLDSLIDLNIRSWWCQASLNRLTNEKLLSKMYDSGCRVIFIGIESLDKNEIMQFNKNKVNDVFSYRQIIDLIQSKGIAVFGSFILGDSQKNVGEDILNFINETNIIFNTVNILTPLPGTELFKKFKQEKRLLHKNWENYNLQNVCFNPENVLSNDLDHRYMSLMKQIYSYRGMQKRFHNLWSKGVFVRDPKTNTRLSRGRILFTLKVLSTLKINKILFVLKSLWRREITSTIQISLALNFHDYTSSLEKNKS